MQMLWSELQNSRLASDEMTDRIVEGPVVSPVVQGRIIGRFSGVDCRGLTEKTLFVPHKCLRKRCPDILVIHFLLSVCQPDLAFVGNAGHLAAVIGLAGSEGLAGPCVKYNIGLLSLYKDSLFADLPEWIAEFMFPRVVLLPNTSRAGGYSSETAGFS